jgi:sulfatase maturation enzyme AslB (radical SAM superfamily)
MELVKVHCDNGYIYYDALTRCYAKSDEIINADIAISSIDTNNSARQMYSVDDIKGLFLKSLFERAYYNITFRCNLNCIYCYAYHGNDYVSSDDNRHILKQLKQLGVNELVLIG